MKKKTIIIVIVIIIFIIGGIYILNRLDFFKNDEQLFLKYGLDNNKVSEIFNNEEIKEVKNKSLNSSYTIDSEINIKTNENNYKIRSKTNAKNKNDILTYIDATKDDTEILDLYIVKDENLIGIKMDELANGYITFKNNNLNSLLKDVETDQTVDIPNSINMSSLMDILELSDEDISYFNKKVKNIIIADTNAKNYSREKSVSIKIDEEIHTVNAYKLTLSEREFKRILIDIFYYLSKDSRALDLISTKLKMINLPNKYTEIDNLSSTFAKISENIKSIDATEDEFLEITLYCKNQKLMQTDFKIKDERIINFIYNEKDKNIHITQELVNGNYSNIFYLNSSDFVKKTIDPIYQIDLAVNVPKDKNVFSTKAQILCYNHINIAFDSTTKIVDNTEDNIDYKNSNKIILNDLSTDKLDKLYKVIKENFLNIYKSKKAIIFNKINDE